MYTIYIKKIVTVSQYLNIIISLIRYYIFNRNSELTIILYFKHLITKILRVFRDIT